jgi:hypothetical protein
VPLQLWPISLQVDSMARKSAGLLPVPEPFPGQAQEILRRVNAASLPQKPKQNRQQQPRIPWWVATPSSSLLCAPCLQS